MEYGIISLFAISVILLILSYFKRDPIKDLEEQVDQLSMSLIQESYQLKKKMSILEEELLMNETDVHLGKVPAATTSTSLEDERRKISSLFQSSLSSEQMEYDHQTASKEEKEAYLLEQIRLRGKMDE